jgi:hypothetical protein
MFKTLFKTLIRPSNLLHQSTLLKNPSFLSLLPYQPTQSFSTDESPLRKLDRILNEEKYPEKFQVINEEDELEEKAEVEENELAVEEHVLTFEPCTIKEEGKNLYLETKLGLFMFKGSLLSPAKIKNIKKVYYIDDFTSTNYIRKVLKEDSDAIIVFDPQASHYVNAIGIYNGYKRKLML